MPYDDFTGYPKLPQIGDFIWVPDYFPEGKGIENRYGGKATVEKISSGYLNGDLQHWVCVKEHNGTGFFEMKWEGFLREKQNELKEKHGDKRAFYKPDTNEYKNYQVARYRI